MNANSYNGEELCTVIYNANKKQTPLESLSKCDHVSYLKAYLKNLKANFYCVERNYINYDYLADYSFYYSKNFTHYYNKCVRIHFFSYYSKDISKFNNKLNRILLEGSPRNFNNDSNDSSSYNKFWNNYYLGFIVIRPIPFTFWGYSVLKHYNFKKKSLRFDENRFYWGVKDYTAHFVGNKISIKNSLAFMSQDGNVAACATIAIWSMLQRAVENYFINLKSPSEITKDAEEIGFNGNRVFPNQGLDLASMCRAIVKSNLAPEVRLFDAMENVFTVDEPTIKLKKIINAYSRLKIPIILAIVIPFGVKEEGHAVAVCGHATDDNLISSTKQFDKNEILYYSEKINKLFAHDDQLGPFSKISFTGNELITDWTKNKNVTGNVKPLAIIAPVFQKVRIPYEDIEYLNLGINEILINIINFQSQPIWNIQLYYSSDFKEKIQTSKYLNNKNDFDRKLKMCVLEESMPKYIWVASLIYNNNELFHFIYDATALRNTNCLMFALSFDNILWSDLISHLKIISQKEKNNSAVLEMIKDSFDKFSYKISKLYSKLNRIQ